VGEAAMSTLFAVWAKSEGSDDCELFESAELERLVVGQRNYACLRARAIVCAWRWVLRCQVLQRDNSQRRKDNAARAFERLQSAQEALVHEIYRLVAVAYQSKRTPWVVVDQIA